MIEIKAYDKIALELPAAQAGASKDLRDRFETLALTIWEAYELRGTAQTGAASPPELVTAIGEFLTAFEKLDQEYGDDGAIFLEDINELVDYCLRCLAELRNWLPRLDLTSATPALDSIIIGSALWALRHECEVATPEPVVNALAHSANEAKSKQELAAVYGLMQGLIEAVPAGLKGDLEKSNPQRPWRVLLINFAIVAVRTQDAAMMRHAFNTLGRHLPEQCPGFFAEAVEQAKHPAFSPEVAALLHAERAKWTTDLDFPLT
ncbi:MAG: hypothetical protein H0U63_06085 [Burkholderiales bacterium]|nr:hypothetical protein [Burkholderiales bacterium]